MENPPIHFDDLPLEDPSVVRAIPTGAATEAFLPMDLEEGHCNAPPSQVSPKAFPASVESVRLAGARLAIADDGGGLHGKAQGR